MFTGIIEEKGIISKIMKTDSQAVLTIKASKIMNDIHKGDRIKTKLKSKLSALFKNLSESAKCGIAK